MEGKGITSSNIRGLGKQIEVGTTDYAKVYGLVRKNVREAWKLEKSYQDIEEEKEKLKSSLERKEKNLIIETEKMRRTSGSLMNDVQVIRNGLPKVIISPTTTKRSKLPWDHIGAGQIDSKTYFSPPAARKTTETRKYSSPKGVLPSLPRLQKAIEDSKKHVSDVALFCRKVQREKMNCKNTKDMTTSNIAKGKKVERSTMNHLKIPSPKQEKTLKELFDQWQKEGIKTEFKTEIVEYLEVPQRDSRKQSASVSW